MTDITATEIKLPDALDDLLIDEDLFAAGRWVRPDPDRPLRIKTKAMNDAYADAQARQQRQAAKGFGGDTDKLPVALKRKINAQCLIKHCLEDVEGCVIGGQALGFAEFCDLIQEPRGQKLLGLAFTAATMVAEQIAEDEEEAVGN